MTFVTTTGALRFVDLCRHSNSAVWLVMDERCKWPASTFVFPWQVKEETDECLSMAALTAKQDAMVWFVARPSDTSKSTRKCGERERDSGWQWMVAGESDSEQLVPNHKREVLLSASADNGF